MYGEQRDLAFFLNERFLANRFFSARVRAKRKNVTADIMARDSQTSNGYWGIVQDYCVTILSALPFLIDQEGEQIRPGTGVANSLGFSSDRQAFEYIQSIAQRDLQHRGFRACA